MVRRRWVAFAALSAVAIAPDCDVVARLYGDLGSLVGSNQTDSCDRRFGAQPEAFCQEIDNTVAGSQFRDDCTKKFQAPANIGGCPRDAIVGGCAIDTQNEDGSNVTDWYYDVTSLVAEAGTGAEDDDAGPSFPPSDVGLTVDEVRAKCADPMRYSDGAHYVGP